MIFRYDAGYKIIKQKNHKLLLPVDSSGRLQTVYEKLILMLFVISEFNKLTGVPIVLNTSF